MSYLRGKVLISTLISSLFILLPQISVFAENSLSYDTGTITAKVLNLRQSPNQASKILAKIKLGEKVKIIDNSKDWHKVNYKNIEGWISGSYIKVTNSGQKAGKVNVSVLKVRKSPNTTAPVITKLQKGEGIQILDSSKNWYKIKLSEKLAGWVCSDYVSLVKETEPRKPEVVISRGNDEEMPRANEQKTEVNNNEAIDQISVNLPKTESSSEPPQDEKPVDTNVDSSANNMGATASAEEKPPEEDKKAEASLGQLIVDNARAFIGTQYKYGGNTPEEGFDCSGFTKYVFSYLKINLERTAASQAMQGIEVKKEELAVGDLVFFDTTGNGKNINHVGIYIGDCKFIHASSPGYGVTITNITDNYYLKSYMISRRIINP